MSNNVTEKHSELIFSGLSEQPKVWTPGYSWTKFFKIKWEMPGIEFRSSSCITEVSGLLKTAELQGLRRDGNPEMHRTERQDVS